MVRDALPPHPFVSWEEFQEEEARKVKAKGPVPFGGGCGRWWCCGTWWAWDREATERATTEERAGKGATMESFDVWIRKRAAQKPHLYGPVLASEGRELAEAAEATQEPVVAPPAAPPQAPAQPVAMDFKSAAAGDDGDDAEVVEDAGMAADTHF